MKPDPSPELAHRDRRQSLLTGQIPCGGEHLGDRRLSATRSRAKFKHCMDIPTLFEFCQVDVVLLPAFQSDSIAWARLAPLVA